MEIKSDRRHDLFNCELVPSREPCGSTRLTAVSLFDLSPFTQESRGPGCDRKGASGWARGAPVALTLTASAPEFPRDLVAVLLCVSFHC